MNVTASSIATAVLSQFNKLPKKGKPTIKSNGLSEWTVLAGIVITSNDLSSPQCVALGTGLKCLPKIMLNHCGLAVNDSHAEVICRRNWQRYMMTQVMDAAQGNPSILELSGQSPIENDQSWPYQLKSGIQFHMYVSQSPCGDASMRALDLATLHKLDKNHSEPYNQLSKFDSSKSMNRSSKRKLSSMNQETLASTEKQSSLENKSTALKTEQISSESKVVRGRSSFTTVGKLRTKPGRADAPPTTIMSCSDKIAKWNAIGLGGALLSFLVSPVYLSSLIIGDLFDQERLYASLVTRVMCRHSLSILQSYEDFKWAQSDNSISADAALSWYVGSVPEVIVQGRKQGASKKNGVWPTSSCARICKLEMGKLFMSILHILPDKIRNAALPQGSDHSAVSYRALKSRASAYQKAKNLLYDTGGVLEGWIQNDPSIEAFDVAIPFK
ncbi:hypothetical protein RTP6_000684 [Batrachochytrium dendrobatidis]